MGCHKAHKGGFLEEVMPQHLEGEVVAARGEGRSISSLNECSRGEEEHGDAFRFHGAILSLLVRIPSPGLLAE